MGAVHPLPTYSLAEEIAHAVSHGIGIILAIAGLAVLVTTAALHGDPLHIATFAVFGSSLVLLYVASTLYHSIPIPSVRPLLRTIDHSAIYLLIAGSYTPWTLGPLRGPAGWALFALVWTGAVVGVVAKSAAFHRMKVVSLIMYVAMGWCILLALEPLRRTVPPAGIALLVAGGVAYSGGLVFYGWKSLRFHHFFWHLCVLAGSICHFFAVLYYALPAPVPGRS